MLRENKGGMSCRSKDGTLESKIKESWCNVSDDTDYSMLFCYSDRKKLKKRERGVVGLSSDSCRVFYYGCGQVGLTPPRGPRSGPQCPAFDCGL